MSMNLNSVMLLLIILNKILVIFNAGWSTIRNFYMMIISSRCSLHRRAHKVPQHYKQDHLSTQADVDDGDDGNYGDRDYDGDDGSQCIHGVRHVVYVMLRCIYTYYELFANPDVVHVLFSQMVIDACL